LTIRVQHTKHVQQNTTKKRSKTACSGKQRTYQRTAISRWMQAKVFINSLDMQFTHFAQGQNRCNFWPEFWLSNSQATQHLTDT